MDALFLPLLFTLSSCSSQGWVIDMHNFVLLKDEPRLNHPLDLKLSGAIRLVPKPYNHGSQTCSSMNLPHTVRYSIEALAATPCSTGVL